MALRGLVWVDASANRVATVYTNAPKRRREPIFAYLCTLLRPHVCPQRRNSVHECPKTEPRAHFCQFVYTPAYSRPPARLGGATGPMTSTAPWPRATQMFGPEAHPTGAVTQPPTHTNSRSLYRIVGFSIYGCVNPILIRLPLLSYVGARSLPLRRPDRAARQAAPMFSVLVDVGIGDCRAVSE